MEHDVTLSVALQNTPGPTAHRPRNCPTGIYIALESHVTGGGSKRRLCSLRNTQRRKGGYAMTLQVRSDSDTRMYWVGFKRARAVLHFAISLQVLAGILCVWEGGGTFFKECWFEDVQGQCGSMSEPPCRMQEKKLICLTMHGLETRASRNWNRLVVCSNCRPALTSFYSLPNPRDMWSKPRVGGYLRKARVTLIDKRTHCYVLPAFLSSSSFSARSPIASSTWFLLFTWECR